MFNNFFSPKILPFTENVEKYSRAGQATDDKMLLARCMLDTYGYKHTLRMCNTYFFSTMAPQCYVVSTMPVLFILSTPCPFCAYPSTHALIQYITIIKLLHVSAPDCHAREVRRKEI
jgi:hypothetical protein